MKRSNITQALLGPLLLQGLIITRNDSLKIIKYVRKTTNPIAKLSPGSTIFGLKPAPEMALFSSRGPNSLEPNIIKPDVTAPGLNILAAWSEGAPPTTATEDNRVVKYNLASGTSMSCPHVSAAVVLLKAIHPSWSSADADGEEATPFQLGSGHIRPHKAMDPGLVYDATFHDYLLFLCGSGFDDLSMLSVTSFKCPEKSRLKSVSNFNYPSVAITNINGSATVFRTVTNVGQGISAYNVTVKAPLGYRVDIAPKRLYFTKVGEKKEFAIRVRSVVNGSIKGGEYVFGWFAWSDGYHFVRSAIVVSSSPDIDHN